MQLTVGILSCPHLSSLQAPVEAEEAMEVQASAGEERGEADQQGGGVGEGETREEEPTEGGVTSQGGMEESTTLKE